MSSPTQQGYLVLADISGFTSYLAQVELDHAHEILTELLEAIVGQFSSLLTIAKLEGDAVFAYAPAARLPYGETLLELLEATYTVFRDRVEAARRHTTCECRACRAIPTLDLKFIVHFGEYILQTVRGARELVGSDVNLAHRLLKNGVTEATGWTAYILLTAQALDHLAVSIDDLHPQVESVPHFGDVRVHALDLHTRYQALVSARRHVVTPEETHVTTVHDFPVPPPIIWEWLNDPTKRSQYAPEPHYVFQSVARPGGRAGVGARTHCIHGKKVAMLETVLDWRPFDYYTVVQAVPLNMTITAMFKLLPTPDGGTHLEVRERGRFTGLAALDRALFRFLLTTVFPTARLLAQMDQRIAAESATRALPDPTTPDPTPPASVLDAG